MYCYNCGKQVSDNAKFCTNCGASLTNFDQGTARIKLVSAVCPQCGARIKVNPDIEASVCEFCGNAILVDRAIQNFYSNEKTFINNGTFKQAKKDNKFTVELEKEKKNKYAALMVLGVFGAIAVIYIALAFMIWAIR